MAGVIFHSDKGCHYTSEDFRAVCDAHGVKQSMGKTGVCWDCEHDGLAVRRGLTPAMTDFVSLR